MHVPLSTISRVQNRSSDTLQLELEVAVRCQMWALGTEFRFSAKPGNNSFCKASRLTGVQLSVRYTDTPASILHSVPSWKGLK